MSMNIEIVTEALAHMKPGFSPCGSVCLISNRSPKMLRHRSRPCILQNCQLLLSILHRNTANNAFFNWIHSGSM